MLDLTLRNNNLPLEELHKLRYTNDIPNIVKNKIVTKLQYAESYKTFTTTPDPQVKNFLPKVSPVVKDLFFKILLDLQDTLIDIEYACCYGTHLGQAVCEDMMPWDDDIDIWIEDKHRLLLEQKIANHPRLRMKLHRYIDLFTGEITYMHKLWSTRDNMLSPEYHLNKTENWGYPFVDIAWLQDIDDNRVVDVTNYLAYNKKDIFPAVRKKLNKYWFSFPNNNDILNQRYEVHKEFATMHDFNHIERQGQRDGNRENVDAIPYKNVFDYINKVNHYGSKYFFMNNF